MGNVWRKIRTLRSTRLFLVGKGTKTGSTKQHDNDYKLLVTQLYGQVDAYTRRTLNPGTVEAPYQAVFKL